MSTLVEQPDTPSDGIPSSITPEKQQASQPPHSASARPMTITVHATVAVPESRATAGRSNLASIFSSTIDFIKVVAWPLLALFMFITFSESIRKTIELIPGKLQASDKGSIGSLLSWEIQQQARQQGGTDLAGRVAALSPLAIEELMSTRRAGKMILPSSHSGVERPTFSFPKQDRLDALVELERTGLIKFDEPLLQYMAFVRGAFAIDPSFRGDRDAFVATREVSSGEIERVSREGYELTEKGAQALDAIIAAIREQLQAE